MRIVNMSELVRGGKTHCQGHQDPSRSVSIFDRETEANSKMVSINAVSIPRTRTVVAQNEMISCSTQMQKIDCRGHVVRCMSSAVINNAVYTVPKKPHSPSDLNTKLSQQ